MKRGTDEANKRIEVDKKLSDAQQTNSRRAASEMASAHKKLQDQWKADDAAAAKSDAKARQVFGAMATQAEGFTSAASSAFGGFANNIASSFTRMAFYGEKWKQSLGDILKDVVAMFFQAVLEMEIRWLAFMAIQGIAGMFGGGAMASAGSSMPTGGKLDLFSLGGAKALGGDDIYDRPTLIRVGDGGTPERVTSRPLTGGSSAQSAGGGGGDTFNIGPFIAQGNDDPQKFGRDVMTYIMQQIRGRGQIKSVGPGLY